MDKARWAVNADYAYNLGLTGKGIGIAVLDTGLSPSEDFLLPVSRIAAFRDFVNEESKCYDDNGHGTHVSGIACSNGWMSQGKYCGIAPQAHIIAIKILDSSGRGSASTALKAIKWITENREKYNIKIANMSVGTSDRKINQSLLKAMYKAWDSGICIIAADGNAGSGNTSIASAGRSSRIITVGSFENPSPQCDVTAPSVDITSCLSPNYSFEFHGRSRKKIVGGRYIKMSGTSMATPMVSGAAALLAEKYPNITPDEMKSALIKCSGQNGLIDIYRLLY